MADPNVWIQGATALSPAMQDVARGNTTYYENNLAQLNEKIQRERVQSVARMGAERLSQYGPQGKWWAERLLSDPVAAVAMAEQLGGFAQIENEFKRGAAASEEARLGRPMTPTDLQAFIEGGAQGAYHMGSAKAAGALAGQRESTTNILDKFGMGGAGANFGADLGNSDLASIAALSFIRPEIARSLLAVRKAAREPGEQALTHIQAVAKPFISDLAKMDQDWKFVRDAAFVKSPANDAWLVKLFVRSVEPGLMVTQAESGDVVRAASDDVGILTTRILKTLTPAGLMTDQTRRMLAESIDSAFKARASASLEFMDGLETEASSVLGNQQAGINVQRALIGDDAPRNSLSEKINTDFDFDSIGPRYDWNSFREPTTPQPPAKMVGGKRVEAEWDSEVGAWYWDVPE